MDNSLEQTEMQGSALPLIEACRVMCVKCKMDFNSLQLGAIKRLQLWQCKCGNVTLVKTTKHSAVARRQDGVFFEYFDNIQKGEPFNTIRLPDEENECMFESMPEMADMPPESLALVERDNEERQAEERLDSIIDRMVGL